MPSKIAESEITSWIVAQLTNKFGVPARLLGPDAELIRDMRMDDDDISDLFIDIEAYFQVSVSKAFDERLWPDGRSRPGRPATLSDVVAIALDSMG